MAAFHGVGWFFQTTKNLKQFIPTMRNYKNMKAIAQESASFFEITQVSFALVFQCTLRYQLIDPSVMTATCLCPMHIIPILVWQRSLRSIEIIITVCLTQGRTHRLGELQRLFLLNHNCASIALHIKLGIDESSQSFQAMTDHDGLNCCN